MNSYVFLTETGSTHYCCLEGYAIWLHHYLLYIMEAAAVVFLLFSELLLDRYVYMRGTLHILVYYWQNRYLKSRFWAIAISLRKCFIFFQKKKFFFGRYTQSN